MKKTEQFLIGAIHDYDQCRAAARNELEPHGVALPPEYDDLGLALLRKAAGDLDLTKADLDNPRVRDGAAWVLSALMDYAVEQACCESHAGHLAAVSRMAAQAVARLP